MNAQQQEVARKIAENEWRYDVHVADCVRAKHAYDSAMGAERLRAFEEWQRLGGDGAWWYFQERARLLTEWSKVRDPNAVLERETTGTP